jgi:hypothetical protein
MYLVPDRNDAKMTANLDPINSQLFRDLPNRDRSPIQMINKKGLPNLDASDAILDECLELEELPQLLICPSALHLSLFLLHIRGCWARHLGFRHPTVFYCYRLCGAGQGGLMQRRLLKPAFLLPGLFLFERKTR